MHVLRTVVQRPADTLAGLVMVLGPDSPCLCCGSPLRASPVDGFVDGPRWSSLACAVCGAVVADDLPPMTRTATAEREPALVAA